MIHRKYLEGYMSNPNTTKPALEADALLDEALEESFPASDPISPGVGSGEPIDNHTAKSRKAKPD